MPRRTLLHTLLRTLLPALLVVVAPPARAQAQAPLAAPPAGTLVRLRVTGASGANELPGLPNGAPTRAHLVGIDAGTLTVRVGRGWQHTIPRGDVGALEIRRGRGLCGGTARRAACLLAGTTLGFAAGYLVDRSFGVRQVRFDESDLLPGGDPGLGASREVRQTARIAGTVVGLGAGAILGRDQWRRIDPWATR